jgi:hypothetical protein
MYTVLTFINYIFDSVRALFGLISPMFAEATDFKNWPVWMRVIIACVFIGAICFGLYLIGNIFQIDKWVTARSKTVQDFYLPIFFLLMLVFSWLVYGLWSLLAADTDAIEFPDILENWVEAKKRLAASGLEIGDLPVFLMVGMPEERLDPLFLATGVQGIIRTPSQGQPAIRIYAWEKAIFVVCPGASAWGQYCIALSSGGDVMQSGADNNPQNPAATLGPGEAFKEMDDQAKAQLNALLSKAARDQLSAEEQEELRILAEKANEESTRARNVQIPENERSLQTRRLRFLCRLIRNDRKPWCSINGVVVLVPWAALETDRLTDLGIGILNQELVTAREVFRQRYPTFAILVDLETAEGFEQFASMFHLDVRKRRIGQGLPLVPTLRAEEMRKVPDLAAKWIGTNVLPSWILKFLKFDPPTELRNSIGADVDFNRNLYHLLRAVYLRCPRLAQLLARGVPSVGGRDDLADAPMLGGCYLTATGSTTNRQAFVEGVFQRVVDAQGSVSWSPEALEEDSRLSRYATIGNIAAILLFIVCLGASFYLFRTS